MNAHRKNKLLYLNIFTVSFLLSINACTGSLCGNEIIGEYQSPDGRYVATVFERNCGATTPYERVVSLRESRAKFDPENQGDWIFTSRRQPQINISWKDTNKLIVVLQGQREIFTQREFWKTVQIIYLE